MKKIFFCLFLLVSTSLQLVASPGDTTWVTVFNERHITAYGNIDTTTMLPAAGTQYRKIRLHYILGRYACPPNSDYCGSWDYTTSVYALPPAADTVELTRVITPYATDWLSTNRKHDYTVDVTDYASILHDELAMRYIYEGYSWGFTLTLKIEFIEGVPPMDAIRVDNVYDGYFAYGSNTDPIENHLTAQSFQFAAPVASTMVKNIISGHGMDNTGCGEFCSKYYRLNIDGNQLSQKQLWKSNCGLNNISPQTGTWLYDRANWCPGEVVYPILHPLNSVTSANTPFTVDMDFQPYTTQGQQNIGGYNVVTQLVSYGAPNHALDASIEDIISPSNDPNYARSNGICNNPVIKIKNNGSTALMALTIEYGLIGGQPATYNWSGNLAFLEEAIVDLGESSALFAGNQSNKFFARIVSTNSQNADEQSINDRYDTQFIPVRSYPSKFVVYFRTNNGTENVTSGGPNETNWTIKDAAGTIVASRVNNANNTTFRDTLDLPSGCYTFEMSDANCDGISWWMYANYPVNPGTGVLRFSSAFSGSTYRNFNGDFGCGIKENFTIGYTLDVEELDNVHNNIQVFPNPASKSIQLVFDLEDHQEVNYSILDVSGKEISKGALTNTANTKHEVETGSFNNGIYFIRCNFADGTNTSTKFVISH
jgi:hypothetical protein